MIKGKNLFWGLSCLIGLVLPQTAFSVLPGTIVTDERNYWGHNGKLASPNQKAAYVVCDGYIGSPLIPDAPDAISSFAHNCENSPPPGSLPIIDIAENHSPNYKGYPAYPVKSFNSDRVYFLCDGFLNSTAWCSQEAHLKAQKLIRASESKYWEPGEKALIINDMPVKQAPVIPKINAQSFSSAPTSLSTEDLKRLNIPAGAKVVQIDPSKIDPASLPPGAYIKAVPMQTQSKQYIASSNTSAYRQENYFKPNYQNYQKANYVRPTVNDNNQETVRKMVLSDDLKYFLVQAIESAVDRALDRRGY